MRLLLGSSLSLRRRLCATPFALTDANIVCVGSSLTEGTGGVTPYPTILGAQLAAANDFPSAVSNEGHGSWSIDTGGGAGRLITLIVPDIHPLWNGAKQNILVLEGTTNDLYLGASGAQAYQRVKDYIDLLQSVPGRRWKVIFVTPTPRNDAMVPPGFAAERTALLALVAGDPTFGGRVDEVFDLGQDVRLQDTTDQKYYQPDQVHYTEITNALFAAGVITTLGLLAPSMVMRPVYSPAPNPYLDAASGVLNGAGLPAADGETVGTWQPLYTLEAGDFTQANNALRPTFRAAGIGADPALEATAVTELVSATNRTCDVGYTWAFVMDITVAGFLANQESATVGQRFQASDGAATYTIYDATSVGPVGSLKYAPANSIVGQGKVVLVATSFGPDATHRAFKVVGGVVTELVMTTFPPFNGNPTGRAVAQTKMFSGTLGCATGRVSRAFFSPIPFTDAEIDQLAAALAA